MALADVYQVTVSATQAGSLRQNTLAFTATTADTPDLTDFDNIATAIKELYRVQQSNTVTYTGWKARQIAGAGVTWPDTGTNCYPTGGLYFEGTFSTLTAGGDPAAEVLPPQCSLVTTLRTGMIGRSRRGRVYAYGYTEAQQNIGVWNATLITPVNASWTSFMGTYGVPAPASGYRLGVWSHRIASGCRVRPDGTHERVSSSSPTTAFTPVSGFLVRTTVYTQRRRVSGAGL